MELQDLLQRLGAAPFALDERKVVERQMRDQPPLGAPAQWRADAGRGLTEAADAGERRGAFEMEVALRVSEREPGGQIAVAARRAHGDRLGLRRGRVESEV